MANKYRVQRPGEVKKDGTVQQAASGQISRVSLGQPGRAQKGPVYSTQPVQPVVQAQGVAPRTTTDVPAAPQAQAAQRPVYETQAAPQRPVYATQPVPKQTAQPQAARAVYETQGGTTTRQGVSDATAAALAGYEQGWQPSANVRAAQAYLDQLMQERPGAYESPYGAQMSALLEQINGREPFSYNLNEDMLYQQYRDQYQNLGRQAMQDTMGQAAGLTGGYGSSYSQRAGQQAYQGYLQQLNDKVPELYDRALDRYRAEGNDLYQRYGLLADAENDAYGRYRDQVGDWRDDRAQAYSQYNTERGFDYDQWADMMDYWRSKADSENSEWWKQTEYDYQKGRDAVEDDRWRQNFDYQKGRDAVEDDRWRQNFEYQKSRDAVSDDQWERQFAAAQAARYASGGGGSSGGSTGGSTGGSAWKLSQGARDAADKVGGAVYDADSGRFYYGGQYYPDEASFVAAVTGMGLTPAQLSQLNASLRKYGKMIRSGDQRSMGLKNNYYTGRIEFN